MRYLIVLTFNFRFSFWYKGVSNISQKIDPTDRTEVGWTVYAENRPVISFALIKIEFSVGWGLKLSIFYLPNRIVQIYIYLYIYKCFKMQVINSKYCFQYTHGVFGLREWGWEMGWV